MNASPKIYSFGGHGVDIGLSIAPPPGTMTSQSCYWTTKTYSSYILVKSDSPKWETEDGSSVRLISVNGLGEIRWEVSPYSSWGGDDGQEAVKAFNLKPGFCCPEGLEPL